MRFILNMPMPPLPFKSFHIYEARPKSNLPDQFVISITSATYVSRQETSFLTVVPLREFQITYDHPLIVIVDPAANRDIELVRPLAAYVSSIQSIPSHLYIPHSQGEISEVVKKELKKKLNGWLDLGS
ncbi:hypothetical protein FUA23_17920 [Neolewinella aurantiaca]|uniref:Uncharacterized protein n=1 Tax=Neolewinella aurantiaca TaxID=2602767 RepID=A0A5C7FDV0_9BACT|nr:hypothetical protein [Neolewinella aurantiaca]TXF87688.1 hypothetical protein FUA23_17920 [Neolewinella aurantiaca]